MQIAETLLSPKNGFNRVDVNLNFKNFGVYDKRIRKILSSKINFGEIKF